MAYIIKIQDGHSFYAREGETLLEVLESKNIPMEYQCRQGYCGSCQVTLVEGQVEYNGEPPLAFIPDGCVLPCCCQPRSDLTVALPAPAPQRPPVSTARAVPKRQLRPAPVARAAGTKDQLPEPEASS